MPEDKDKRITKPGRDRNFWNSLLDQGRLVLRLMADKRVPFFYKVLPAGSLLYLIAPDLLPFIIDDAMVLGVGIYLFIELCPPDVVAEHRDAINGVAMPKEGDVMEAEFKEAQEDQD